VKDSHEPRSIFRRAALALPFAALALVVTVSAQQAPRVIPVEMKRYDFVPATIEVAQGERVVLRVTSSDRLHGIGIRKLRIDRQVAKGDTVEIAFIAPEPGTYEVICTEDCGKGHEDMKGSLVVKAVSQ
jgi:cytochrome c oxidase subunit 2